MRTQWDPLPAGNHWPSSIKCNGSVNQQAIIAKILKKEKSQWIRCPTGKGVGKRHAWRFCSSLSNFLLLEIFRKTAAELIFQGNSIRKPRDRLTFIKPENTYPLRMHT